MKNMNCSSYIYAKSLPIGQHSSTSPYMDIHTFTLCSDATVFRNLLYGPRVLRTVTARVAAAKYTGNLTSVLPAVGGLV